MDIKALLKDLNKLLNLVKSLDDIGSVSAIEQAIIKKRIEHLYENVISDYFESSTASASTSAEIPDGIVSEKMIPVRLDKKSSEAEQIETSPLEDTAVAVEKEPVVEEPTESPDKKDPVFFFEKQEADESVPEEKASGHSQNGSSYAADETDETEKVVQETASYSPALEGLFNIKDSNELSERLSSTPIQDILKAMGLNERIFTQNELFGGDNDRFRETLNKLNSLSSFAEAKHHLLSTVATEYDWADKERKEVAENFIQLVNRRFKSSL